MKSNIRTIAMALLALGAAACASPEQKAQSLAAEGWEPLGGSELTGLFSDHTHWGDLENGGTWAAYYAPDGTMRGSADGPGWGPETDSGTFTVSDDGIYCRKWARWSKAQEGCGRFLRKGSTLKMIWVSGTIDDDLTQFFAPGNSRAL